MRDWSVVAKHSLTHSRLLFSANTKLKKPRVILCASKSDVHSKGRHLEKAKAENLLREV